MARQTKMNSITSPELLSKVNPENSRLLNDFLIYLRAAKKSEGTIKGYESDIKIAWVWCLKFNDNKPFTSWSKRNIVSLQDWLINNNQNSPARIRRLKAALSSLSNYIERVIDDEFPDFKKITNKVESPLNRPVRQKTVWEDEELELLLENLTTKRKYQQACYLALAMYSGRRKAELCRFKVTDFDDDKLVCDGGLYKSDPIKTKGLGGGKIIPCYTLAKKFKPYFDAWMTRRKELGIESEWIFPNPKNRDEYVPISTLNSWSETFSRISGKSAYVHSLRHYFTTSLYRAGIPESVIQSIVAWESSDMVRLYTDIEADEQISMYFKNGDIAIPDKKGFSEI